MIIEQQLKDKMEQALQNAPDLAVSIPLSGNDIYQLLFAITKAQQVIEVETQTLQQLNQTHSQLIDAMANNQSVDQQTLDRCEQVKAAAEQILEQLLPAQTTSDQNEEE